MDVAHVATLAAAVCQLQGTKSTDQTKLIAYYEYNVNGLAARPRLPMRKN